MNIKKTLTALLAGTALLTAGCVGGGNSANKMETPQESPIELQVSAAASLTDAMKELGAMYEENNKEVHLVKRFISSTTSAAAVPSSRRSRTAEPPTYSSPPHRSR